MTTQERLILIQSMAKSKNIVISTITQNLLDTYYDDRFVGDYLYHLLHEEQLSTESMSEVLGFDAQKFYTLHQNTIHLIFKANTSWQEDLSESLQVGIKKILETIGEME